MILQVSEQHMKMTSYICCNTLDRHSFSLAVKGADCIHQAQCTVGIHQ